jgi:3-deoxy-D-manno-octulosonic-acid transferase
MRVFLLLWSALWTLGLPFVFVYLAWRARRDPAYLASFTERLGHYRQPLSEAIWIHAVSLGEVRSAVPLIQVLLARGNRVVTTHFTPAGRAEAERVFGSAIASGQMQAIWVPIETAWAFRAFFRAFRPALGLVMEIEIWPRMVFAAKSAQVPLLMCNAQYPSDSLARDSRGFGVRQQVMRNFEGALVKSDLQAERFRAVGVPNIMVTGELRFDQPVPAALVAKGQAARIWIGASARRVICIASAIEGEDATYLHTIRALRDHCISSNVDMPLFVYVPRRPERFNEVAGYLRANGLSVLRRSELGSSFDPSVWGTASCPDVFLGDSLGEMYGYLAMSDEVIVGGGFNPKGAHNISEALALGKPVVTGPYTHTIEYPFVEAANANVACSVADEQALAKHVIAVGNLTKSDMEIKRSRIEDFVKAHSGAVLRTLAALDEFCSKKRQSKTMLLI